MEFKIWRTSLCLALVWLFLATLTAAIEECDDQDDDLSLWERYICPFETGVVELQAQCHPQYSFQTTERKRAMGLVVAFHGYSACPDSFVELASAWNDAGFDVMVPLLPGQGRTQGECVNNQPGTVSTMMSSDNDGTTILCAGLDRIDDLPTNRQGYIDFAETINAIVSEEKCRKSYRLVIATGLSHGGPLATYAVNTAPKLYDKLFIMNPSFAVTSPPLDRQFAACVNSSGSSNCVDLLTQELLSNVVDIDDRGAGGILDTVLLNLGDSIQDVLVNTQSGGAFELNSEEQNYSIIQSVLRRLLATAVENFDQFQATQEVAQLIQSSVYSWGAQCELERANGRGGICSFLVLNILAAHSFGQLALRTMALSDSSPVDAWQIVSTERDAVSRNTLIFQAALALQKYNFLGPRGGLCIYRIVCSLEGTGNECGVPHSMLSRLEQELQGEVYWLDDLIRGSIDFFTSNTPFGQVIGDPAFPSGPQDRATCQRLTISSTEPAFDLSLPKIRGVWLRFELESSDGIPLSVMQEAQVAQVVMEITGALPGLVQPVVLEVVLSPFKEYEVIQELYLEIPATLVRDALRQLERSLLSGTAFEQFFNVGLLEVEIAGRLPRSTTAVSRMTGSNFRGKKGRGADCEDRYSSSLSSSFDSS